MKHTPLLALTLLAGVLGTACAQLEDTYNNDQWSTRPTDADTSGAEADDAQDSQHGDSDKGADAKANVAEGHAQGGSELKYVSSKQALPTGKASTSALLLTKSLPEEVVKGEEFTYTLVVENLTGDALDNVFVEERLPTSLRALDSDPAMMSNEGGKLLWNVGTLDPKGARTIQVKAMATADGLSESFAIASYDNALQGQVMVISPALALSLNGPEMSAPGDTIDLEMTLTNTGTGTARNVDLTATLPEGMQTLDGKSVATMRVDSLGAGQNKVITLQAKAARAGSFSPTAEANLKSGKAVTATSAAIKVEETRLAISSKTSSKFILGTPGKVEYTVNNIGNTLATDVKLTQPIPEGMEMVRSSMAAEQAAGVATWSLGDIPAGESKVVTLHLLPSQEGTLTLNASAQASKGAKVENTLTASMEGLAALHFALEDLQDPVPVGESLTYHVKVHNQGTAPGSNIQVEISLDEGMQLVRAAGPTNGRAEGNKIIFKPLETLEPDATATWRLVIQSRQVGDLRLTASLTSKVLKRPVTVTESTQFYD